MPETRTSTSDPASPVRGERARGPSPMMGRLGSIPDAERMVDDVIITPRVLDARAFADHAAALTELIQAAAGEGQSLQATFGEVRQSHDQLQQAARDAQQRLELAARVLPALEQRVSKAGEILAQASAELTIDRSKALDAYRTEITAKRREGVDELGRASSEGVRQVDASARQALETIEKLMSEGLAQLREALERGDESVETLVQDAGARLFQLVQDGLSQVRREGEHGQTRLRETTDELVAAAQESLRDASARTGEDAAANEHRLREAGQDAISRVNDAASRAHDVAELLESTLPRAEVASEQIERWLSSGAGEKLESLLREGESLMRSCEASEGDASPLARLLARGRRLTLEVNASATRIAELAPVAERVRQVLGDSIASGAMRVDELEGRLSGVGQSAAGVQRVLSEFEERIDLVRQRVDALNASCQNAREQAERSSTELDRLLDRGSTLFARFDAAIEFRAKRMEELIARTEAIDLDALRTSVDAASASSSELGETLRLRAMEMASLVDQGEHAARTLDERVQRDTARLEAMEARVGELLAQCEAATRGAVLARQLASSGAHVGGAAHASLASDSPGEVAPVGSVGSGGSVGSVGSSQPPRLKPRLAG
ncbi:MAG: hypothetical protein SFZ23_15715 [Planctomycetota bacterium]|nr:hypothetical protein [Planctomycetota bacterium]